MKILHITASYKPAYIYGGPIASVSMLCECLTHIEVLRQAQDDIAKDNLMTKKERLNVEVFTTTANGKAELEVEDGEPTLVDGVLVTYFKRWTKDHSHFSPGLLWDLRKKISQFKNPLHSSTSTKSPRVKGEQEPPHLTGTPPKEGNELVIHIHAWWNLVSVLSCLVAKWYKVPVILSPRGMLTAYSQNNSNSFSKKIMQWFIGDRLLKYCHLHVTSEQEKNDVLHIIQPKSITIIPNLVNIPTVEQQKAESTKLKVKNNNNISPFKLLFLSRIEEKKGLELLFEALAIINFDYHLTIAGSGEESYVESLKRKAESLKVNERIKWIGQVSNEEKFSVMAAHDLLVLPSHNENFANVIIESLSVGTSILVSKNVGLADYVKANEFGWICDLKPLDIAEKIMEAYKAVAKREKINSIAPVLIRNDFNDAVLAKRYVELYEAVLRHPQNKIV